jgi:hypothetical protein
MFFAEATRVLKDHGIIAVWSYNLLSISPEVDAPVNAYYHETLRSFWPPERMLVEAGYNAIVFPFEELEAPRFAMETEWTLQQLVGYAKAYCRAGL